MFLILCVHFFVAYQATITKRNRSYRRESMFFGYWIKFLLIFYINTKIINWCKSLRLEVLIRIIALLQRKTLIETKNCTLKCLKRHYSSVRSMKNVAVLTEDGAFALFFRPHPGGFDSSRVPTPRNLPSKAKKNANARGSGRSWKLRSRYYLMRILVSIFPNPQLNFSFKVSIYCRTFRDSIFCGERWTD